MLYCNVVKIIHKILHKITTYHQVKLNCHKYLSLGSFLEVGLSNRLSLVMTIIFTYKNYINFLHL